MFCPDESSRTKAGQHSVTQNYCLSMETYERTLETTTDDGDMVVVITEPTSSPPAGVDDWPTVLWFFDLPGLRPAVRDGMARLASEGYRVVTPDLHHRHGRLLFKEPKDMGQPGAREEMVGWLDAMTDDEIQHDGARALDAAGLATDSQYMAIGFCLGTRAVYKAIEADSDRVLAGACFHPSLMATDDEGSPHHTAAGLSRPMYLGIGEEDQVQSIAMHQRFLDAVEPLPHVEVITFPGADHAFTWPGYPTYDETAAETSWAKSLALFAAALTT